MIIYLESYGCSANLNNSEIIKGILEQAGFIVTNNADIADIAILNTCVVKGPTERRMIKRIKELCRKFSKIVVSGCMPDIESLKIRGIAKQSNSEVLLSLVGVHNIAEISKAVKSLIYGKEIDFLSRKNEIKLCLPKTSREKIISIVQISEGCTGNCSYCYTKFAKGDIFSYPLDKIVENIKQDLKKGCGEIWLTSQDNAAYGCDRKKYELPELLKKIFALRGKFYVRIGMMNPSSLLPILNEIIELYKDKKMFKFLHIPVQSGSDKILKAMNRDYKIRDFLIIVEKFRKNFPEMTLSTDIICGFPGETEKDFLKSLDLIKKIKPEILNISKFWPMPKTRAEAMMKRIGIDDEKNKMRAIKLMKMHKEICLEKNRKLLNRNFKVLADKKGFGDTFLARDINYRLFAIKSKDKNILGKSVDVSVNKIMPHYVFANA